MIFHENCLLADNSHVISYLIFSENWHFFAKFVSCSCNWRFKGYETKEDVLSAGMWFIWNTKKASDTTITHCRPTHSTVRKSHRMVTTTRHQEDNTKQSNQLSLPHQDDCKTGKDTKQCTTKHGTNTEPHNGSNNPIFLPKSWKILENLSFAAVMIGTLWQAPR